MNLQDIGKKRQKIRQDNNLYKVQENNKPKYYILDMFPYPSGAGLHVGHPKGYVASDCLARKKMLEGFNVLHPMGFDTFGLGTEQYAIDNKMKPQDVAKKNIATFISQLEQIGLTFDRDRSFSTADPEYYKWTQWIFLKFYTHYYDEAAQKAKPISELETALKAEGKSQDEIKHIIDNERLAYVDYKPINRCPSCKTGLANEDLDDGKCERCGSEVEQKPMRQWVLRITKYADRLITGLDKLSRDESMKDLERNRIGKSEGTQFKMNIENSADFFEVYTTRVDTVFGMSFVVMAPEHPLADKITTAEYKDAVAAYKEQAKFKTQLERTELQKEKTGQFTGTYAINPFNGDKIPVYVGDYVLANYGTGVVMAVPAHDERDFEFARKYNIPIKTSILWEKWANSIVGFFPVLYTNNEEITKKANSENYTTMVEKDIYAIYSHNWLVEDLLKLDYEGDIRILTEKWDLTNSWEFTGLTSDEAIAKMQVRLTERSMGGKKCNYKIQDRVFSRQRYRGEPFPVVFCNHCNSKVSINFRNQETRNGIVSKNKTIETRALNPEEPERYFGDIKVGDIILAINKETNEEIRLKVSKTYQRKSLKDMREHEDHETIKKIYRNKETFENTKTFEDFESKRDFTPEYNQKIQQNGIVGREFELIWPEIVPMNESDLPLLLPDVDNYEPTGTEEGPLADIDRWMNTTCPHCGKPARRESNTMPGWAGSSWYWLRYMDPKNADQFVSPEREKYRGAVDTYVWGAEHVTRHMIYARFWQKFLFDLWLVTQDEPFLKYQKVGLIMAEDGRKMSKRRNNVVLPDDVIAEYGSDTFRTYEMFMGPFDQSIARSTNGMKGVKKFLEKIMALKDKIDANATITKDAEALLHQTIKKLTEEMDDFKYNTSVAQLMILVNKLGEQTNIDPKTFESLITLVAPFAPHLSEELWEQTGHTESIFTSGTRPKFDESKMVADSVKLAVQVNGKVRGLIETSPTASQDEVMALAKADDKIAARLTWDLKKIIYVPGKIVNIVV